MKKDYEVRPEQSVELLQALHILTRDGKMNQDSRRKLKQVYHLFQFIEPLLKDVGAGVQLVDHGAGKSYLGFILYDLFFKHYAPQGHVFGIETREALVQSSCELAERAGFDGMSFLALSVADSIQSSALPERVDVVTALHACDTATDDAIRFALAKNTKHIVLVPCCQAEVAAALRALGAKGRDQSVMGELWRRPLHARELGSHLTNVLRCLQLESKGYQVTVTELVGWEHSMKNELIIASRRTDPRASQLARKQLESLLANLGLTQALAERFLD